MTRPWPFRKPDRGGCDWVRASLSEYLDGSLAPAAREAARAHLAGCAGCRAELASIECTVALLRGMPEEPLPRAFLLRESDVAPEPAGRWARIVAPRILGGATAFAGLALAAAFAVGLAMGQPAASVELRSAAPSVSQSSQKAVGSLSAPAVAPASAPRPATSSAADAAAPSVASSQAKPDGTSTAPSAPTPATAPVAPMAAAAKAAPASPDAQHSPTSAARNGASVQQSAGGGAAQQSESGAVGGALRSPPEANSIETPSPEPRTSDAAPSVLPSGSARDEGVLVALGALTGVLGLSTLASWSWRQWARRRRRSRRIAGR